MIAFSTLYIRHGGGWLYLSDTVCGWVSGWVTYDRHPRGVVGFVPHDIDSSFRSVHKRTEQTFLKTETNQTQLNKCFFPLLFWVAHIQSWENIANCNCTPNLLMSHPFFYSLHLAWGWLVISS